MYHSSIIYRNVSNRSQKHYKRYHFFIQVFYFFSFFMNGNFYVSSITLTLEENNFILIYVGELFTIYSDRYYFYRMII